MKMICLEASTLSLTYRCIGMIGLVSVCTSPSKVGEGGCFIKGLMSGASEPAPLTPEPWQGLLCHSSGSLCALLQPTCVSACLEPLKLVPVLLRAAERASVSYLLHGDDLGISPSCSSP